MQATTDISWIPALDIRIHLGIDGISLPLLVLTALLTFLCALYSYFKHARRARPRRHSSRCCSSSRPAPSPPSPSST